MKKMLCAAVALIVLSGCSLFDANKTSPAFVIVNVLDREAYNDAHIKGSIQVDFEELEEYAHDHWDKENTTIVIHCSNYKCTASGAGAQSLMNDGFKKVYAYEAGTAEALKEGVTIVGKAQASYLKDYQKPEGFDEMHKNAQYSIITTDKLKEMMKEFAAA